MEAAAMKVIGAGLAAFGMIGAGIGLGIVFGNFFTAVSRQPAMEGALSKYLIIGMALVEAIALFAFAIAMLILFA